MDILSGYTQFYRCKWIGNIISSKTSYGKSYENVFVKQPVVSNDGDSLWRHPFEMSCKDSLLRHHMYQLKRSVETTYRDKLWR